MKTPTLAAGVLLMMAACAREPSLADLERDGASALHNGDVAAATKHVETGTRIAGERHDANWQQRFRVLGAEVLVEQGRIDDALKLVGDAVVAPGVPDRVNVRLLIVRGRARCSRKGPQVVLGARDLEAAAPLVASLPPDELAASLSLYRGNCALLSDDGARAEREFRQAYTLARERKSALFEGKSAGSIGLAEMQGGRYDEAFTWFERALSVPTTDNVRARTMVNLGWCQYALGDFERALTLLTEAEALARSRGYADSQLQALELMGNANYRLHAPERAADSFRRALAIARELGNRRIVAELLSNLAIVALDEKQLDTAHTLTAEALQIKQGLGAEGAIQHSRLTEGLILAARGDAAGAEGFYQGVLASSASDRDLQWEARAAVAQLRIKTGRLADADVEFQRAFAIIEQSASEVRRTEHKLSFYSSIDEFQDAYVDFLVGRGDTRRALEVADRSRARLLRDALGDAAPKAAPGVARFQQTAGALNSVILFYWLAPSQSFVWAVSKGGLAFAVLPGERAIAARVDAYQRLILRSRDPLVEKAEDARWLYDTLVTPIRSAVPAGARVVVVPDGALHQLNPETLVAGSPRPHYWIEDVTVSIAPSISVLAAPASAAAAGPSRAILIIGDPASPDPAFPRLANASQEITRIADRFAPDARTVFSGAQAAPPAYLSSNPARYAFIHFAAHAAANRESPLESAVMLSAADDRSKLYARDILRVPIRADLVTISACRSAGARTYAGEGLVGLTWAFLTSGAKNVIAAVWNVDDASTAVLMDDLYGRLAHGDAAADALRKSKLALLASSSAYRKPFYWAPFLTYSR